MASRPTLGGPHDRARRRTLGDDVQVARSHRRDHARRRRGRVARLRVDAAHHPLHRRRGQPAGAGRVRRQCPCRLARPVRPRCPSASARPRRSPPPIPSRRSGTAAWTRDGNAIVVTVRKHKPVQRIRARSSLEAPRRTISDNTHSATQPTLARRSRRHRGRRLVLARPGGLARAGRDPPARPAALRQAADGLPTRSETGSGRSLRVAAGEGGRAVLTWQVQTGAAGAATRPHRGRERHLRRRPGARGRRPLGGCLARRRRGRRRPGRLPRQPPPARPPLRVASGTAGAPLGDPVVLATGGKGTTPARRSRARSPPTAPPPSPGASPAAPTRTAARSRSTRARPVRRPSAPAQTLAQQAHGIVLAGGPGSSAALAWMTSEERPDHLHWTVHASTRPQAGGAFGADQAISDPAKASLWPSIAITPAGRGDRRLGHQRQRRRVGQPDRVDRSLTGRLTDARGRAGRPARPRPRAARTRARSSPRGPRRGPGCPAATHRPAAHRQSRHRRERAVELAPVRSACRIALYRRSTPVRSASDRSARLSVTRRRFAPAARRRATSHDQFGFDEVRLREIGTIQVCAAEPRGLQPRADQPRAGQASARQVGLDQLAPTEVHP